MPRDTARARRWRVWALGAGGLLLVCGLLVVGWRLHASGPATPPAGYGRTVDLPTAPDSDLTMQASVGGVLEVDARGCPYLADGTRPTYAVWPDDFSAAVDDRGVLTLFDNDSIVAHSGDRISFGGGYVGRRFASSTSSCLPERGTLALVQEDVAVVG